MRWQMMVLLLIGVAGGVGAEQLERRRFLQPVIASPTHNWTVDGPTQSLLETLERKGIRLAENSSECTRADRLGFHRQDSGWIDICTHAIRSDTAGNSGYQALLQRVLAHEAVHVAQYCRRSKDGLPSVGLPEQQLAVLSAADKRSVAQSVASGTHHLPLELAWRQEAEAKALESQPAVVTALLHSAC